jgi:hypothetical protein
MIAYWAVPYLVVAAPPAIVLLTILVGGCTMARTANEPADRVAIPIEKVAPATS